MNQDFIAAKAIEAQLPNPYTRGVFYPVEYNGIKCLARLSYGKGRNHGFYLHVKKPCRINTKTREGTIIDTRDGFSYYRISLGDPDSIFVRTGWN